MNPATRSAFPGFAWSLSRQKTLAECPRRYAYEYYFSHNGWLADAPEETKRIYRLKKLTSLEMFFGSSLHNVIQNAISNYSKSRKIPRPDDLVRLVRSSLNAAYIDSTRHYGLWFDKPSRYTMFRDVYYGDGLPPDKIEEIRSRIGACAESFPKSKTFREISGGRNVRLMELERFRTLPFADVDVVVVMDIVYRDRDTGRWVVADWKTGKESAEDRTQLALYAMYLQKLYDIPSIRDITIRNEYLATGTWREYKLEPIDIDNTLYVLERSVMEMRRYMEDIDGNVPYELEAFPLTEYTRHCERCNFKELCGR